MKQKLATLKSRLFQQKMKNGSNKLINIGLLFILLINSFILSAQEESNYSQVILELEKKLSEEALSELEYYNLGTSYAKLDSLAHARLYLEKAQLLSPWNKDVERNIRWVKTELAEDVAIIPEFFLSRIWKKLALSASPVFWQSLGILLLLAILGFAFYKLFIRRSERGNLFWMLLIGLSLGVIICFSFSSQASGHLYGQKRCVIMESQGNLNEAPEKSSASLAVLKGGTSAERLEELGEWCQVRLEDGSQGWIEEKYLKNISFNPTKSSN